MYIFIDLYFLGNFHRCSSLFYCSLGFVDLGLFQSRLFLLNYVYLSQYICSTLTASIDLYNTCHRSTCSCSYIKQHCVVLFSLIVSFSFACIICIVMHYFSLGFKCKLSDLLRRASTHSSQDIWA